MEQDYFVVGCKFYCSFAGYWKHIVESTVVVGQKLVGHFGHIAGKRTFAGNTVRRHVDIHWTFDPCSWASFEPWGDFDTHGRSCLALEGRTCYPFVVG